MNDTDNFDSYSSSWRLVGVVVVESGTMIITDSKNFEKYREEDLGYIKKENINHLEKEGYSVPWLDGDGEYYIFMSFGENNRCDSILIYKDHELENFLSFVEIKKNKQASIKIESGQIAINDPINAFNDDLGDLALDNSFVCGKVDCDIYDLSIDYKSSQDKSLLETFVGTLIELNPKEPMKKNQFNTRVNLEQIITNDKLIIRSYFSLVRNRIEYCLCEEWSKEQIESHLESGFSGLVNYHLERGYEVTFCLEPKLKDNDHHTLNLDGEFMIYRYGPKPVDIYFRNQKVKNKEKNFVDGVNSFCKKNNREVIFEEKSEHYSIACSIKALSNGDEEIFDTSKEILRRVLFEFQGY